MGQFFELKLLLNFSQTKQNGQFFTYQNDDTFSARNWLRVLFIAYRSHSTNTAHKNSNE